MVRPPDVLQYRSFALSADLDLFVNALGGVVVIQRVGTAETRLEALKYYNTEFEERYRRAVAHTRAFLDVRLRDFSFSYLWHAKDAEPEVAWQYVRVSQRQAVLLVEATLVWCLSEVVDDAIRRLPNMRAGGRVEPGFVDRAVDLFAVGDEVSVWTSAEEIDLLARFYDGWRLRERIRESRDRFDHAASAFAFHWESAERRRERVITLALAVVAVIGLLQADVQLARVTGVGIVAIDWTIALAAGVLAAAVVWKGWLEPRRSAAAGKGPWIGLASRLHEPAKIKDAALTERLRDGD